jgi:hypothetical protein
MMAIQPLAQHEEVERVSGRRLWRASAATLVLATAATAVTGLIERAAGVLPEDIASFQPIGIAAGTIVQVSLGIVVLVLLSKYARRPISTFRIVALVALALSMINPIAAGTGLIPGYPIGLAGVLGLIVIHLVAGAIAIGILTTQVEERAQ